MKQSASLLSLLPLAFLSIVTPIAAPAQQPSSAVPLTVARIYPNGSLTPAPPDGLTWSPDGSVVTYLSPDGDLMQLDSSAHISTLVSRSRLSALSSHPSSEKDRDHRSRYGQAAYIWAPDSQHILFDTDGELVLYEQKSQIGVNVAATGAGSGDDPKFSPNGSFISFLRDHNLFVLQARQGNSATPLTTSKEPTVLNGEVDWVYEEELDVRSNYFWSPDSRHIAYLQMDESSVPEYPITDWIPTHATVDRQRYPQPGDPNPSVRVGVIGTNGGHTNWLRIPLRNGDDYIPRFGWVNPNVVWVETLTRDQKHRAIYFADIDKGDVRLMLLETEAKYFDGAYDIHFSGNAFYLQSWRDGHTHIYRYSFNPQNPLDLDATLEKRLTSGDYEVGAIESVDETSKTVFYISNEGDPLNQAVWAVGFDGTGKRRISTDAGFHRPTFAPNGPAYIDNFSSLTTPPAYSLCQPASGCKQFWQTTLPPDLVPSTPTQLQLKAADGTTTLYATLSLPPSTAAASVPLILNPYGGPGAQTVHNVFDLRGRLFDQLLTQHGFAVLHVDNRGMASRGRDFEQVAYHNFGPIQLADQLAALDQVLAKYPQLDARRLGWWGWSWGGTFTLNALSHSDRFRAGVSVAPVTDWRNYDSIYTERYMSLPAENPDGYRDNSVVNSAKDLKGHLLLVHGTGDDNVHIGNSVQYLQKLIDADIHYDLLLYPRKTHSIAGSEARRHLFEAILAHFDRYLKPLPEEGAAQQ